VTAVTAETPQIGSFDSSKKALSKTGALVFGPYLPLEPDNYRAAYKLSAEGSGVKAVGNVDVNAFFGR
jgi:hypothetical protein